MSTRLSPSFFTLRRESKISACYLKQFLPRHHHIFDFVYKIWKELRSESLVLTEVFYGLPHGDGLAVFIQHLCVVWSCFVLKT